MTAVVYEIFKPRKQRKRWHRESGIAISSFRYWCKENDAMRIDESQDEIGMNSAAAAD